MVWSEQYAYGAMLGLLLGLPIGTTFAYPDVDDAVSLDLGLVTRYDSNPFNLPDALSAETVLGRADRSDWLTRADLSVTGRAQWSLQRVWVRGHMADTQYRQMDAFDHADRDGALGWDWQIGRDWTGQLVLDDTQARVEFDPLRPAEAETLKTRSQLFSARWQPTSTWRMAMGGQRVARYYEVRQQLDANEQQTYVGLDWMSPVGPQLGVELRQIDTDYLSDWAGESAEQRATQLRRFQVSLGWAASERYQITLRSIQQRWEKPAVNREEAAQGMVLSGVWRPAPLWQLGVDVSRLNELPDGDLEPARQRNLSWHLKWQPTAALTCVADWVNTRRERDSVPGPILDDRVRSIRAGIDWNWQDSITLGIRVSKQQRKYASSSNDSTASQGEVSLRWLF